MAVEDAQYPELEEVADRTLEGIPHTLTRHSFCESAGEPGAAVIGSVETWNKRREVNNYFAALKWTQRPDSIIFDSPDGTYSAHPIMAKEPTGPRYAAVYFSVN